MHPLVHPNENWTLVTPLLVWLTLVTGQILYKGGKPRSVPPLCAPIQNCEKIGPHLRLHRIKNVQVLTCPPIKSDAPPSAPQWKLDPSYTTVGLTDTSDRPDTIQVGIVHVHVDCVVCETHASPVTSWRLWESSHQSILPLHLVRWCWPHGPPRPLVLLP